MKKETKESLTRRVGIYSLGCENVVLYIQPGTGANFSIAPPDKEQGFIALGHYAGSASWERIVANLHHEAHEYAMTRQGHRMCPCPDNSMSNDGFSFYMTHGQFSEVAAMAGIFCAQCMEPLKKAYTELQRMK